MTHMSYRSDYEGELQLERSSVLMGLRKFTTSIIFAILIVTQLTTSGYNNSATPNAKPSANAIAGPPSFEAWRFTFQAADAEP